MGLHAASPVLIVLALIAGTQANTLYVFDFESDLQGWESLRGSWRWADQSSLQTIIPDDYKGGFAVMDDQYDSDELYTPYFRVPKGGNFTMKFYLRSRYIHSNDLEVYTRDRFNVVKDFINLKEYSLDDTTYWSITQKELPADSEEVRFEIFCYNGEIAAPGQPLLGCAIDQIAFEVYDDKTTPASTTTTTFETSTPDPTTLTSSTTEFTVDTSLSTTSTPEETTVDFTTSTDSTTEFTVDTSLSPTSTSEETTPTDSTTESSSDFPLETTT